MILKIQNFFTLKGGRLVLHITWLSLYPCNKSQINLAWELGADSTRQKSLDSQKIERRRKSRGGGWVPGWVREGGGWVFLLCGWVAAALCFQRCPDWDGACGIGRRLPIGGVGPPPHYLAPVSFQFLILPDTVAWHQM